MKNIRNFSIIAHIDHGKSTLSDRFIQICSKIDMKKLGSQILDSMDLEKERGITIKSQNVTLEYKSLNGQLYQFNLIDTPGHVDFSYEVFRSLFACEGVVLLVDAVHGIGAQTIANFRFAQSLNLEIILVLNKIDLVTSYPNRVIQNIKDVLSIDTENTILCSAKTGVGVLELLEYLIIKIPHPKGSEDNPLQVLIIDSWFDNYLGIVSLVCIKNGVLHKGAKVKSMNTGKNYVISKLGIFTPNKIERKVLYCGEIGWLSCAMKQIVTVPVGDTLTSFINPAVKSLPSFRKIKPHVYATIFSIDESSYESFRNALVKLSLNDSSLSYELEFSSIFGYGFRCGFLGLLHMDIIKERLEREYSLNLIVTPPMVSYEVLTTDNQVHIIDRASQLLSIGKCIKEIREPIAECNMLFPDKFLGRMLSICSKKRGLQLGIFNYGNYINLIYEFPMSEIIFDFFDQVKSESHGYASCEYLFKYFSCSDIVCVNFLINGNIINELSLISYRKYAAFRARELIKKLQELIPRQQFDIIIQAAIEQNIIARVIVKQLRKNVTARCHGGDFTRKKKLLKKQKDGKRRMKKIGKVILPPSVFMAALSINKSRV